MNDQARRIRSSNAASRLYRKLAGGDNPAFDYFKTRVGSDKPRAPGQKGMSIHDQVVSFGRLMRNLTKYGPTENVLMLSECGVDDPYGSNNTYRSFCVGEPGAEEHQAIWNMAVWVMLSSVPGLMSKLRKVKTRGLSVGDGFWWRRLLDHFLKKKPTETWVKMPQAETAK